MPRHTFIFSSSGLFAEVPYAQSGKLDTTARMNIVSSITGSSSSGGGGDVGGTAANRLSKP